MKRIILATLIALGIPVLSSAATVTLTNNDAINTSSFNTAGWWNSGLAPVAGNDYVTSESFRLRTPASGSSFTFAGDSLRVNGTNGLNTGLMYKGTGATGVLTFNNLILDGGWIHHQNGSGDFCRIAGNITVQSDSRIDTKQGNIIIDATMSGSGTVTNASNDNNGNSYTTTYTANNSAFTGRMVIRDSNNRVQITNEFNLGGNPASFTADQLLVESGWLQTGISNDVVLDDPNRGITLAGTWSINPQSNSTLTIVCPITGTGELNKRGPGVLALAGDNSTHSGGVRLGAFSAGSQLNINSVNALGAGPFTLNADGNPATIDNGSGSLLTVASTFAGQNWNNSFRFLGSSSLNLLGLGGVTLGANVTCSVSNNSLIVGTLNGAFNLTKAGAGTLVVDAGDYRSGNTVVSEGTMSFTGLADIGSPVITVASNAFLDVGSFSDNGVSGLVLNFGQTLAGSGTIVGNVSDGGATSTTISPGSSAGTLTINGNLTLLGGGALSFELGPIPTVGGGTNDLITVNGVLTFGNTAGNTTLNIIGVTGSSVTYTLFQYNTFSGSLANVTVPPGYTLTNNTANKTIQLISSHVPANLTWVGDGSANVWDIGVTPNWSGGGTLFYNSDSVTFNDTGDNSVSVNLASDVSPSSVTISATKDYTFTGYGIANGSVTKSGSGTLILDNTNTYSGPTVINGGTLQLGSPFSGSFGLAGTLGTGPVTNNGVLQFARGGGNDVVITNDINGSGSISNIGSFGTVVLSGKVSGTTVNQAGAAAMRLSASNDYTGLTLVSAGTLYIGNSNALGTTVAGTEVTLGANVYVDLGQPLTITGESLLLDGGQLQRGGAQSLVYAAPITLGASGGTFSVDGGSTIVPTAGGVAGAGALTKSGSGALILTGNNGYTGKTVLNGGNLLIDALPALGPTPGAATADFVTFNGGVLAITNSQTFSGGLRGLTIGSAGTLYVQDATAIMTVSGDLNGGGLVTKWGPGTLILSGSNPWAGTEFHFDGGSSSANDGITRITSPNALASMFNSPGVIGFYQGNNNSGWSTLELDGSGGSITLPQDWSMNCRNNDNPNVRNLAGNNTISGTINLNVGGNRAIFQSDAGLLTISGLQQYVGTLTGGRTWTYTGAGNILVSGQITNSGNGAPISLAKNGTGTLTLSADNTYGNITTINGGVLNLTGSLTSTGGVFIAGGALAGNGTINDNVTAQAGIGSGTIDTMGVNGNFTINGNYAVDVNRSGSQADRPTVSGTVSAAAGSVTVYNLGAALQVGDTFALFNGAVTGGGVISVVGGGAVWNNNLGVNGTISVASIVPSTPTEIDVTRGTGTIDLSWPASHKGWVLQTQTNSLAVGIAANWTDIPGTASVTSTNIAINPTNPTVFFRLRYP